MKIRPTFTKGAGIAVAITCALTLSACGSDDNTTSSATKNISCASGSVSGAGSTFVQNLAQQWIKDYTAACSGSTINYQGVGSGAGIQQLAAGTVDFAGSDVPMKTDEQASVEKKNGTTLQIPWSAGAIAVEYKLNGMNNIKMSADTLAGIFAGKITKWNDVAITADNSGTILPSTPIQIVHRSDGSGTTAAFTSYLSAAAPSVWTYGSGKEVPWPTGQGAKGSDGVTAAVKTTEGAIGYAELSYALANSLGTVNLKNIAGTFVGPSSKDGVTSALAEATVADSGIVTVNYKPTATGAYPISTVTYALVPQTPTDATKAMLLKSFVNYALTGGQDSAATLYYAPLPDTIVTPAKNVAAKIGPAS